MAALVDEEILVCALARKHARILAALAAPPATLDAVLDVLTPPTLAREATEECLRVLARLCVSGVSYGSYKATGLPAPCLEPVWGDDARWAALNDVVAFADMSDDVRDVVTWCDGVRSGRIRAPLYYRGLPFCAKNTSHWAGVGDIQGLQWARVTQGRPWAHGTCGAAARGGHLHALQWLRENGCPWDMEVCVNAATRGDLAMLQWARANNCPWDCWTCSMAASHGHLDVLQWAHAHGAPFNHVTCDFAAGGGHINVLEWAHDHDFPWGITTCDFAAGGGHINVLEWAHAHGCPWGTTTCAKAAGKGKLQALQWLRQHDCPWDKKTCTQAAFFGHVDVLAWARDNQCPYDAEECARVAQEGALLFAASWNGGGDDSDEDDNEGGDDGDDNDPNANNFDEGIDLQL